MSTFPKAKKIYDSRMQFRAVQKEVESMLKAGHRKLAIYEQLTAEGKLTISYTSMWYYIRGNGERLHSHKKQQAPVTELDSEEIQPDNNNIFHHHLIWRKP